MRSGLLVYKISRKECHIISLSSEMEDTGIAPGLLENLIAISRDKNCEKIKLVTTNGYADVLRFYQKKGFVITNFYKNSINEISRKITAEIPLFGSNNIPIRDEIELTYQLSNN